MKGTMQIYIICYRNPNTYKVYNNFQKSSNTKQIIHDEKSRPSCHATNLSPYWYTIFVTSSTYKIIHVFGQNILKAMHQGAQPYQHTKFKDICYRNIMHVQDLVTIRVL
jgi:hypothetical protein